MRSAFGATVPFVACIKRQFQFLQHNNYLSPFLLYLQAHLSNRVGNNVRLALATACPEPGDRWGCVDKEDL
jgi:hypothetical protein